LTNANSAYDSRMGSAKPADDLFYSPKGKRSGTWALCGRERAVEWLKARNLNKD
jgi:hypothetical protein